MYHDPFAAGGFTAGAVLAGAGTLTYTGFQTLSIALIAVAAILVGLVILRVGRRRSKGRGSSW